MEKDLWASVGNKCLSHADELLKGETVPTAATVETVEKLVEIAIAIDALNLRWTEQNRFCAQAFRGQLSGQTSREN